MTAANVANDVSEHVANNVANIVGRTEGAPSSIVGVEQASSRRRCIPFHRFLAAAPFLAPLVASVPPSVSHAQGRDLQRHHADEPEGRLIAFYSSAMLFTPLGAEPGRRPFAFGIEGALFPRLSEAQRRPGIDKPESTNLAPVLPRPRLSIRGPADLVVEASWVPPVRVGDAKANLFSGALSRTVATWRGIALAPRLSAVAGRVRGAITCNAATAREGGPPIATYYANVCHGNDSDDWFEPRVVAGDLVASRAVRALRADTYVAVGGRVDRTRFDIGVLQDDGERDVDHPVLQLRDTRAQVAAGARWRLRGGVVTSAEWLYAPGSLSTVRVYAGWRP